MKSADVRLGIIGCGRIAGHHCRAALATVGVELRAVCDLDITKAAVYSNEFGVPKFTNYRKMLEDVPDINLVAIATPSGMHFEHASEIISKFGKNILVEKPTFMRDSQVHQAFALADAANVDIFPVFQNRHNLAVRRVLDGISNGELGNPRIVSVRVRWCRPQRYYDLAPWRGSFAMDGGALTNQGIHHVDLLRLIGGPVSSCTAAMATLGAEIEVEDAVVGAVRFESGAVGSVEITTSARPKDYEASISIVGDNGLAQIGGIAVNELQVYTPDPEACEVFSEDFSECVYGNGHRKIYEDICAHMGGGQRYPVDRFQCSETIQLLNAFYRSDEAGDWVGPTPTGDSRRLGRRDDTLADLYRISDSQGNER